jgi:hypothetical protein
MYFILINDEKKVFCFTIKQTRTYQNVLPIKVFNNFVLCGDIFMLLVYNPHFNISLINHILNPQFLPITCVYIVFYFYNYNINILQSNHLPLVFHLLISFSLIIVHHLILFAIFFSFKLSSSEQKNSAALLCFLPENIQFFCYLM